MTIKRVALIFGIVSVTILSLAFPAASQCDLPTTGNDTINCTGRFAGDQIGGTGNQKP